MKDDNAYNFRVIDYGDSVQVRLYSTPVLRGGQVSKLDRLQLHDVSDDEFDELLEQKHHNQLHENYKHYHLSIMHLLP